MEITPLELFLTIQARIAEGTHKINFEKESECSLCYCALYDNLETTSM